MGSGSVQRQKSRGTRGVVVQLRCRNAWALHRLSVHEHLSLSTRIPIGRLLSSEPSKIVFTLTMLLRLVDGQATNLRETPAHVLPLATSKHRSDQQG